MSNIGGKFSIVTSYEIQVIEALLTNSTKLMSLNSALNRLRLFDPEEVHSPTSPNGYYYASTKSEEVYEYYKKQKAPFFTNRALNNFEELKDEAIAHCEKYEML
jgi:hypothetical protein